MSESTVGTETVRSSGSRGRPGPPPSPLLSTSRWRSWTNRLPAALLCLAALDGRATAAPLTALERQHFIAHLEMVESWLVDEVSGLSPAQLQFRPAPGTWTITEVVNHLYVSEPIYWQDLQNAVKAAPSTQKRSGTDADILWYGIDRTQRGKAVSAEQPSAQSRNLEADLDSLRKLHALLLQYTRTTGDDLRSHVVERQGCDAYQWLLLISTHEQRHVLQIREIKADPKFPKK